MENQQDVLVLSGTRTAIGKYGGGLAARPALRSRRDGGARGGQPGGRGAMPTSVTRSSAT